MPVYSVSMFAKTLYMVLRGQGIVQLIPSKLHKFQPDRENCESWQLCRHNRLRETSGHNLAPLSDELPL
jgi:hypothetical protein